MDLRQIFFSGLRRKHLLITTCIEKHYAPGLLNENSITKKLWTKAFDFESYKLSPALSSRLLY